jgi:hypothetical protein
MKALAMRLLERMALCDCTELMLVLVLGTTLLLVHSLLALPIR